MAQLKTALSQEVMDRLSIAFERAAPYQAKGQMPAEDFLQEMWLELALFIAEHGENGLISQGRFVGEALLSKDAEYIAYNMAGRVRGRGRGEYRSAKARAEFETDLEAAIERMADNAVLYYGEDLTADDWTRLLLRWIGNMAENYGWDVETQDLLSLYDGMTIREREITMLLLEYQGSMNKLGNHGISWRQAAKVRDQLRALAN